MTTAVERFLKYVSYDTQSDEAYDTCPSTKKQLLLANELKRELEEMGASDVRMSEYGYLFARIPDNTGSTSAHVASGVGQKNTIPALGFISHMDTAPSLTGTNVKPRIVQAYDGKDIVLNAEKQIVMKVSEFPFLADLKGQDLIVTDGTTLLGADDKAGVAEIMTMAEYFLSHPEIPHGEICIGFTPDEEIGRGTENFDIARFGAAYACTFDGGELGELESENFNAASATLTVTGVGVHPGAAKNKMVNAARIAANFAARLPVDLAPETTEGREGFLHPHEISGSVTDARVVILIRDHDKTLFEAKKTFLRDLAAEFAAENPRAGIRLEITDFYENMRPYVERTPAVMALVREAFADAGVTPVELPIRGGTDGAMLSVRGLPCPNIFTGGLNYHGVYECLPVRSLEKAAEVAVALARRSATLESLL